MTDDMMNLRSLVEKSADMHAAPPPSSLTNLMRLCLRLIELLHFLGLTLVLTQGLQLRQ